jgi:hypothetical protein
MDRVDEDHRVDAHKGSVGHSAITSETFSDPAEGVLGDVGGPRRRRRARLPSCQASGGQGQDVWLIPSRPRWIVVTI